MQVSMTIGTPVMLMARLETLAKKQGRSRNALVNEAIEMLLQKYGIVV